MFFTALNSMQSPVKEKYNYWCGNRSLIYYSMLSKQAERATEDEKQYRFRCSLFKALSSRKITAQD